MNCCRVSRFYTDAREIFRKLPMVKYESLSINNVSFLKIDLTWSSIEHQREAKSGPSKHVILGQNTCIRSLHDLTVFRVEIDNEQQMSKNEQ